MVYELGNAAMDTWTVMGGVRRDQNDCDELFLHDQNFISETNLGFQHCATIPESQHCVTILESQPQGG